MVFLVVYICAPNNINFNIADPMVSSMTLTNGAFLQKDTTVTFVYDVDITNDEVSATHNGNDIAGVTSPDENFAFQFILTDTDPPTLSDYLASSPYTPTTSDDLSQSLAAQDSTTFTLSVDIDLPDADCGTVTYLCVYLTVGTGASYTDNDEANNILCTDVTAMKSCDPGEYVIVWVNTCVVRIQPAFWIII